MIGDTYQDLNQLMSQLRLKIQVNNLLQSRKVAGAGFKPITSSYSYWCSRSLSYQAMVYQLGFIYWFHLQCLVSEHFKMENIDWPGFEPGTSLMYTGCSNQLSYQSVVLRMWVHLIPELSTPTSLTPRL